MAPPPSPCSSARALLLPADLVDPGIHPWLRRPAGGLALLAISSCSALFLFPELPYAVRVRGSRRQSSVGASQAAWTAAAGVAYVLHSKSVRFGSDPGLCILVSLSMMLCAQKIIRVTSSRWSSESNTHEVELFSQWTHIVNRFVTLLVFSKKTTRRQDIFCSKNPCAHFELIRTCFLYHTPKISMLFLLKGYTSSRWLNARRSPDERFRTRKRN